MIKTKSAEEPSSKSDGLRLYITRYWPRGHSRDECDEWLPNLGPSEKLLRQIQEERISWKAFERAYKKEMTQGFVDESHQNPRMRNSGQKYVIKLLQKLAAKSTITLICTCPPDAENCHRFILQKMLQA